MKPTKNNVINAIDKLVDGYKNNSLNHTLKACPLCKIYVGSFACQTNCINKVFSGESEMGCVNRCDNYEYLNWNRRLNYLVDFWKKVKIYLGKQTEEDILTLTPKIKKRILEIARDLNKQI